MIAIRPMKDFIFTLTLLGLLVSCGKRSGLEFLETQNFDLQEKHLSFNDLKERIIVPHCLTCHKRSGTEEGIEKWIVPGDPENSKIYQVIKNGTMPKKAEPLSTADLEFVRQYIMDIPKVRAQLTVDFETLKNEILVPHCLSCHKRMDNEESLKRWINTEAPMKSRLLQAVLEGKMPKNAAPLTKNDQNIIIQYLNNFLVKEK